MTTRKGPDWYHGIIYKSLAPSWDLVSAYKSGNINSGEYTIRFYNEVLHDLNPNKVISELSELSNYRDIMLLCYEKSGQFCHRHLVADWLTKHTGTPINELL